MSGPLADYLGRRRTLMTAVIPLVLGWITMAMSNSVLSLIFARFLCGFATGILGGPGQVNAVIHLSQCQSSLPSPPQKKLRMFD